MALTSVYILSFGTIQTFGVRTYNVCIVQFRDPSVFFFLFFKLLSVIECSITTTQGVPSRWRHCEPHPQKQEGWGGQPLIHRYHGLVTAGEVTRRKTKIILAQQNTVSHSFRNLRSETRGSASLLPPYGRSWDPGYTIFFIWSVNFHS